MCVGEFVELLEFI